MVTQQVSIRQSLRLIPNTCAQIKKTYNLFGGRQIIKWWRITIYHNIQLAEFAQLVSTVHFICLISLWINNNFSVISTKLNNDLTDNFPYKLQKRKYSDFEHIKVYFTANIYLLIHVSYQTYCVTIGRVCSSGIASKRQWILNLIYNI